MSRLIDADLLMRDIEHYHLSDGKFQHWVEVQPTIEERKKGKWIRGKCDQCGAHAPFWPMASTYYESDYCPNCGADMRGDET